MRVTRKIFTRAAANLFCLIKDVGELSWMSHGVIRFWFLLNFPFISAPFDILAYLSIPRVFQAAFQVDEYPLAQIFPEQLANLII